ncbi:MAG: ISKra4 family transposase [Chloroflexi bacterium]|nr:ISKra4 family transposase [Chloroflexota bacterium]
MSGRLSPSLHEQLVRLSSWLPFAPAAQLLADFMHVPELAESLARRYTEAAGAAYVQIQTEAVEPIEQPPVSLAPERLVLEADGAMVPLVGGQWTEAKTLIVAAMGNPVTVAGEEQCPLREISSFSRVCDNQQFERLSLVETQRRGLESAQRVAALADGAEWIQGLIDYHRPDAVRILDFAHAAEYLTALGASVHGEHTPALKQWLVEPCHRLKHEGGQALLPELHRWSESQPQPERRAEALAYLDKRLAQMAYPHFRAQGWPIGSGAVESANKLVVEARLKGAGMHWERTHVNPMLALRNVVCSDRWDEAWAQIVPQLRRPARQRRAQPPSAADVPEATSAARLAMPASTHEPVPVATPPNATNRSAPHAHRPAPDHPWRQFTFGRNLYRSTRPAAEPKS